MDLRYVESEIHQIKDVGDKRVEQMRLIVERRSMIFDDYYSE